MTEISIRLRERAREVEALKHIPNNIQSQGNQVKKEDRRPAFIGLGEQEERYEKYAGGSKLRSIVDADLNAVDDKIIELGHGDVKRGTISKLEGERLGERIKRHI